MRNGNSAAFALPVLFERRERAGFEFSILSSAF
jgi:hypothetical protein